MSSTELVTTSPETGIVGDSELIRATARRVRAMMAIPPNCPDTAVMAMSQIAVALNLNPLMNELYLAEFKGNFVTLVGVSGFETMARRQSDFMYEYRDLSDGEMVKHLGEASLKNGAYGCEIKLWHLARAQEVARLNLPGLEYKPQVNYGFFMPGDNIPKTWTKVILAQKRALSNVLKRAFDFNALEQQALAVGASIGQDETVYEVIEQRYESEMQKTAPVRQAEAEYDDDGIDMAPPSRPSNVKAAAVGSEQDDVGFYEDEVPFQEMVTEPEDVIETADLGDDPLAKFYSLYLDPDWQLESWEGNIVTTLRELDEGGKATPATPDGYGKLAGRLAKHGVNDGERAYVLAILFGRRVNKDNRPSSVAARSLFTWLGDPEKSDLADEQAASFVSSLPSAIYAMLGDEDGTPQEGRQ